MGRIVVNEFVSLDGVVQAPGHADEDRDGGFAHGGWHMGFVDPSSLQWVTDLISAADGYLFGRRTYELLAGYWPHVPEAPPALAEPLNTKPKYVVTSERAELEWHNSTDIGADLAATVPGLPGTVLVIGSGRLVQGLIAADLVDELQLMVDPVTLGGGKGLFPIDGVRRSWRLGASRATSSGALLLTYLRG